jgi:hypothetical protein
MMEGRMERMGVLFLRAVLLLLATGRGSVMRRVEGGGWREEGGGWRVEGGGWRVEGGGWRVEERGKQERGKRERKKNLRGQASSKFPKQVKRILD